MTIRTRFAPSPTGYMHVGNARTALFNWAFARANGGQFILRIEDTDRERSTDEAIEVILQSMDWLGLNYDGTPIYQTERMARYQEIITQLLESGHAYRCRCSKARLDEVREMQTKQKQKPRYDGFCRDKNHAHSDEPYVIRFCTPETGSVVIEDLVHGSITVANSELDDLVIARSDGTPTYNLCVVVDDLDMKITHVIRGDDHINNTPRQVNILKALGAEIPIYAHTPMILGNDGKRLSKRHGTVSVLDYREQGYLASAFVNYLIRLGWSHGDQEIFSMQEIASLFDIANVNKAAACFDTDKLNWLNQHYIKETPVAQLVEIVQPYFAMEVDKEQLSAVIALQADRCKTLAEMVKVSQFFFIDEIEFEEKAARKFLKSETAPIYEKIIEGLRALGEWRAAAIHEVVHQVAEVLALKLGKVAQPIRVAISGGTVSPSIDVTLECLGRDKTLIRLEKALTKCKINVTD